MAVEDTLILLRVGQHNCKSGRLCVSTNYRDAAFLLSMSLCPHDVTVSGKISRKQVCNCIFTNLPNRSGEKTFFIYSSDHGQQIRPHALYLFNKFKQDCVSFFTFFTIILLLTTMKSMSITFHPHRCNYVATMKMFFKTMRSPDSV